MLTAGVDLAAEPAGTALVVIRWDTGKAVVTDLVVGADDEAIIATLANADKTGIDCPLGWPAPFAAFLTAHQTRDIIAPPGLTGQQWRRQLAWRATDKAVHDQTGLNPLSVAADRIGHTAMRCAGLLGQMASQGRPVDRRGTGPVAEVYPAASLKCWGLPWRGYKRPPNAGPLGALVDDLLAAAPWLDLGPYEGVCRASHDAVDSVIAALTARAAAQDRTTQPDDQQDETARTEGWIALPAAPLSHLLQTAGAAC